MPVLTDLEAYQGFTAGRTDRDVILINRGISRKLHHDLTLCIAELKQHENVSVVLTTLGGDPHAGYRVARALRHYYKQVRLLVPSHCKSAGTLIAIGANELAIGDLGELGPLDIQVPKPGEAIIERGSGLDVQAALQQCVQHATNVFFSFYQNSRTALKMSPRLAGEIASKISAGLLAPLYTQIDPLRLGEMQRAMAITLEYGRRLDGHTSNMKPGALEKLVIEYPAHEFVIDRKEAKTLFNKVSPLSDSESAACARLWNLISNPAEHGPYFVLPPPGEPNGPIANGGGPAGARSAPADAQSGAARAAPAKTGRTRARAG
jgi:hypothetical protein